jgi:hypothetical protein
MLLHLYFIFIAHIREPHLKIPILGKSRVFHLERLPAGKHETGLLLQPIPNMINQLAAGYTVLYDLGHELSQRLVIELTPENQLKESLLVPRVLAGTLWQLDHWLIEPKMSGPGRVERKLQNPLDIGSVVNLIACGAVICGVTERVLVMVRKLALDHKAVCGQVDLYIDSGAAPGRVQNGSVTPFPGRLNLLKAFPLVVS